jgi:Tfp pilus assembly protein PilX
MRLHSSRNDGSVLASVLVISALLTLSLVAYLTFVSNQHKLTGRSQSWNGALVMAESGVEEALTHINYSGTTNFAASGWTLSGGAYRKTRTLGDGYFNVALSTSSPPTISATGFVTAPLGGTYISRAIQTVTTNVSRTKGLIAKTSLSMSGGIIDSFDSLATGGQYNPTQATANAYVAVASGVAGALKVTSVYGDVRTGAGGSVTVVDKGVGDAAWVDSAPGTIQAGHFKDDFNQTFADVAIPFTGGYLTPAGATVNGTNYLYVLNGGDYKIGSVALGGGKYALIRGKNRWLVDDKFTVSGGGWVWLEPGATLELYVGGDVTVSGSGFVNTSQTTTSLSLFGLPTCTKVTYSGSSLFVGSIYAPSALLTISGSGGASGSAVADKINMSGGSSFHCDTALYGSTSGAKYVIISWNEL